MDREQIDQNLKDFKILARHLSMHLNNLTSEDITDLFPTLTPILHKVVSSKPSDIEGTGDTKQWLDSAFYKNLEEQIQDLTIENQRQSALLDSIFDADPGGLAVLSGPDLRFVYANPAYRYICPQLGIDPIGRTYDEIWPEANGDGFHTQIQRVLDTGRPFQTLGYSRQYPDGTVRYFTFQARRIEWENELAALIILWDTTELQKSQQAARKSEAYFRKLIDLSPEAIFVQTNGCFAFLNEAALRLFGAERMEQILGKPVLEFIHPGFRQQVTERIQLLNNDQKQVPLAEEVFLRLDGSPVEAEVIGAPYFQGNQPGAIVIARDITERVRAEKELRALTEALHESVANQKARSAELSAIMDATPAYIWIARDPQGIDITGNRAAHEVLRMIPGENLSKSGPVPDRLRHFRVMRDGHEVPPAELPVQKAASGVTLRDYEFEMVFEDGEIHYLTGNASPVFDEQGRPAGAVSAFIDVTERALAEQRTAEERERFRITLASIGDAVITTDQEGQVTFLNPVAEQLMGWSAAEASGQPLGQVFFIINEQTHQPAENPVERVLKEGHVVGLANHAALISRSGQIIPIEDSAAPIKDSQGHILGVVMVFYDVSEKRKAEQELEESEARFRLLMDNIPQLVWMADAQGQRYWFNKRWYDYTGATFEEMQGLGWKKVHHPDYVTRVTEKMRHAFITGDTWEDVFPLRGKDGQYRWFLTRALPQRDANGRIVRWFGTNTDITDQKLSEEKIAQEQEWFHTTLASIGDAVITTDKNGNVTFLNPVAENLTGWSRMEAVGRPMTQVFFIVNEQTRQPAQNPVERVLQEGHVIGLANHTALISRDGRTIPIEDSAAPIKDAAGQIMGVVMVFHDVTEKRKTEKELQDNQILLRTVLEGIPEPIFMKDSDGRVLLANQATLDLIGKPPELVFGKKDNEFYDDQAAAQAIIENDRRVLESGQTQVIEESLNKTDGRFTFLSTKTPYRDGSGKIAGVIGVARDITERKERENELHKLNRTLQALSKSNQAMMRADNEQQFMQEVCQIIVQDCGYRMVWIGFAGDDENKSVRPVAFAGYENGYLETLHVTWADTPRGRGPTGRSIRTGQPMICPNMLTDPNFIPWREEARKRGYTSSLALPLIAEEKAIGAITIYSTEINPFTPDEVKLLSELANDLSYGLTAFSLRSLHAEAEVALRDSEARFRSLFEGMTEGFALHELICDEHGTPIDYRFLDINPAFERLTGLTQADVKGKTKSQVEKLRGDDPKWIEYYSSVALTGKPLHFENYSPALERYYEVFAYRPAPLQFAVLFIDITERRQAEEALHKAKDAAIRSQAQVEVQRRLIEQREQERQQIARDLHDGPVQALTAASFGLQGLAMAAQDAQMIAEIDTLRGSVQDAINELRMYAQELRPPILFNFGLRRAIEAYLETFREKHPELRINNQVDWIGQILPEQIAIALFRIFQESLNNIIKHAQASKVWVHLSRDENQVTMEIVDNGAGFVAPQDLLALARQGHLGLVGISERVEAVGGRLEIDTRPGGGARIKVQVPLR